jgi:hypothetical protein
LGTLQSVEKGGRPFAVNDMGILLAGGNGALGAISFEQMPQISRFSGLSHSLL